MPRIAQTRRYEGFGFEFGVENKRLRGDYVQAYHACVSFIDAQIGRIFSALKQSGQWDNTIIVLTSDHGYLLGEKFMWGKVMLFEQCDRVPLIIRVPEYVGSVSPRPGTSSDGLVELIDLFPTLAELCDITLPPDVQGQSLVPMLADPEAKGKEVAYTVVTRGRYLGKAIRTQRYRYTEWPTGEELYDLVTDPREEANLASSPNHAATLQRMRKRLKEIETQAVGARQASTINQPRN